MVGLLALPVMASISKQISTKTRTTFNEDEILEMVVEAFSDISNDFASFKEADKNGTNKMDINLSMNRHGKGYTGAKKIKDT